MGEQRIHPGWVPQVVESEPAREYRWTLPASPQECGAIRQKILVFQTATYDSEARRLGCSIDTVMQMVEYAERDPSGIDVDASVAHLFRNGASLDEMAQTIGVSRLVVQRTLARNRLPPTAVTRQRDIAIRQAHEDGESIASIARRYSISYSRIRQIVVGK
jgi:hypothetical protein